MQKKKRNLDGLHLVQLYIKEDKWQELKQAADSVQEPITTWIRRAVFASLRNWKSPGLTANNWPKCSYCGKKHDAKEHEI